MTVSGMALHTCAPSLLISIHTAAPVQQKGQSDHADISEDRDRSEECAQIGEGDDSGSEFDPRSVLEIASSNASEAEDLMDIDGEVPKPTKIGQRVRRAHVTAARVQASASGQKRKELPTSPESLNVNRYAFNDVVSPYSFGTARCCSL